MNAYMLFMKALTSGLTKTILQGKKYCQRKRSRKMGGDNFKYLGQLNTGPGGKGYRKFICKAVTILQGHGIE